MKHSLGLLLLCNSLLVWANVEKAIFLAPTAEPVPSDSSIDSLYLISLNPKHSSVRSHLNATFPTDAQPKGTETWVLLEGLTPGQRYEVRICWLATQPTSFWLYTHSLSHAFETSSTITSLSSFAHARRGDLTLADVDLLQKRRSRAGLDVYPTHDSLLLLQIFAAADYFSLNKTLMETVPPVLVDLILDPYVLNVFPQSLLPTAGYIIIIAVGAWFLSAWIYAWLLDLTRDGTFADKVAKKVQ